MGFGEEGTLTEKSLIILTSRSAFVNARTRAHGRCFVNHKRVASDDKTRTARDSVTLLHTNVGSSSLVCFGGAGYSYREAHQKENHKNGSSSFLREWRNGQTDRMCRSMTGYISNDFRPPKENNRQLFSAPQPTTQHERSLSAAEGVCLTRASVVSVTREKSAQVAIHVYALAPR